MDHISNPIDRSPLDIAVVGTGIAGMSAAWLLAQRHTVTVYEREARPGGHSNTVEVSTGRGPVAVDTGFIVYNERNYPNLTALLAHLDVSTAESDMSFAASLRGGAMEYAGTDLNGLLGQRVNILRPRFWRIMRDLFRFYRDAPALLSEEGGEGLSLSAYLDREGYGAAFIEDHLLPMGAAIWSTTAEAMRAYPAIAFVRFFVSHGLLNLRDRPQWRTVVGGSREYVRRLTAPYVDRIEYASVRRIARYRDGVTVMDQNGRLRRFDHVVVAAHADQAFSMLGDADPMEQSLLGAWRYTPNRAVLHRDPSLMPKRRRVWSSWNFIDGTEEKLCVTYWMNKLQPLDTEEQIFVTLNPMREPAAGTTIREFIYEHPYFDAAALASQRQLWALQGRNRTWFCGSYFGAGFHEDALQSGLAVAEQLGGVSRPWKVADENGRIGLAPGQPLTKSERVAA